MIKKIIISLLLTCSAAALSSCIKEDMSECPTAGSEVKFQFSINPVPDTQAIDEFKTAFGSGDAVGIFAVRRSGAQGRGVPEATGNYVDNAKWINGGGENWGPATESDMILYPTDGSTLDFYAYYPYQEGEVDPTNIHYVLPLGQAFASEPTMPSLMSAAASTAEMTGADPDAVILAFDHLLSLVQLEVTSATMDFRSAELIGLHREVILDFSADTADQLTELKGELVDFTMETITAGSQAVFRIAAIPQTILKDQNLFKITDADGDILTYSHEENVQLYSGRKQVFQFAPVTIHQVTFDSQGGSQIDPIFVAHDNIISDLVDSPVRQGYNFLGWYKDAAGAEIWDFETDRVVSDITLYAQWSVSQVSVTFDSQGGSAVDDQIVDIGSTVTRPSPDPEYPGHRFREWTSDIAGDAAWDFDADVVTENIVLYAQWDRVFVVMFSNYGGIPAPESQYVVEGGLVSEPDPMEKEGFVFNAWYAQWDFSGAAWDFSSATVTDNMILYARWDAVYTVTFDTNGGIPVPDSQSVISGGMAIRPVDPTKEGYAFIAWYSNPELIGAPWSFSNAITSDITLYARWLDPARSGASVANP